MGDRESYEFLYAYDFSLTNATGQTARSLDKMEMFRKRLFGISDSSETDTWLAVLRVGLGVEVMLYSLSLRNDWIYLLSGTVRQLAEALLSLESHFVPRLGWFAVLAGQVEVDENRLLFAAWASLLLAGCGLLVGLVSRGSAIVSWFVYFCAAKSGGFVSYGIG